jgi:hypothetical protein
VDAAFIKEDSVNQDEETLLIGKYDVGTADERQLKDLTQQAWDKARSDPIARAEITKALDGRDLPSAAPFEVSIGASGIGVIEAGIAIALAKGLAGGFGGVVGAAGARTMLSRFSTIWLKYIEPKVRAMKPEALGRAKDTNAS